MMIYSQIRQLESTLVSLRHDVYQKKEQLIRLQRALEQLTRYQSEFHIQESICVNPEFSTGTWHGNRASKFKSFQMNNLLPNYQSIPKRQLSTIINLMRNKVQEIEMMITSLERSISHTESRIAALREQYRRELLSR